MFLKNKEFSLLSSPCERVLETIFFLAVIFELGILNLVGCQQSGGPGRRCVGGCSELLGGVILLSHEIRYEQNCSFHSQQALLSYATQGFIHSIGIC